LGAYLGPEALATKVGEEVYTGSHLASIEAVVDSKADLAAIDCVTWALVKAQRPTLANQLRVIGVVPTTLPSLPYVINSEADDHLAAAVQLAIRRALQGLVWFVFLFSIIFSRFQNF
jgi:ABC-type phosphate/phosphonate transport system substrate-binding protein